MRPQLTTMERTFQMVTMATAADIERERGGGDCGCAQCWIVALQVCAPPSPIGPHEKLLAMLSVARDRRSSPRQKPGASLQ